VQTVGGQRRAGRYGRSGLGGQRSQKRCDKQRREEDAQPQVTVTVVLWLASKLPVGLLASLAQTPK
jgi:hypothetical protein